MTDIYWGFKYFFTSAGVAALMILVTCIPALLGMQLPDPLGITQSISTSQPIVNIPSNPTCESYYDETARISEEWKVLGYQPSMHPKFVKDNVSCTVMVNP